MFPKTCFAKTSFAKTCFAKTCFTKTCFSRTNQSKWPQEDGHNKFFRHPKNARRGPALLNERRFSTQFRNRTAICWAAKLFRLRILTAARWPHITQDIPPRSWLDWYVLRGWTPGRTSSSKEICERFIPVQKQHSLLWITGIGCIFLERNSDNVIHT